MTVKVVVSLITAGVLAFVGWLLLSISKSGTERSRALLIIFIILVAGAPIFSERVLKRYIKAGSQVFGLARRVLSYWKKILSITSFIAICVLVFLVYKDLRAVGLVVAYTAFLIFSFIAWNKSRTTDLVHTGEISYKELALDQIATAFIGTRYRRDFSLGDTQFGDVPFIIKAGKAIFDTGEIAPEDFAQFELKLEEAVEQVRSIYLLINAGGAWKKHKGSGLSLEGMTIGSIRQCLMMNLLR